jgi:hypothetical protein
MRPDDSFWKKRSRRLTTRWCDCQRIWLIQGTEIV